MKVILISQRVYTDKSTKEIRDTLDIRLSKLLFSINLYPVIVPNSLGILSKKKFENYLNKIKPHGLILSGGEDFGKNKLRDKNEYKLLNYFIKKKRPILGICRGMLLISKFFGTNLKKISGHVKTKHKVKILSKDNLFPNIINSYHNFAIRKCPKNFSITLKSKDKVIEAIKHKSIKCEGWMWHPERDKKIDKTNNYRLKKIFK